MLNQNVLLHNEQDLELEIERKCVAMGLHCEDETSVRMFAKDLLRNIDALRKQAAGGNMNALIKVELYGLAMLMHRTNTEAFGPGYLSQFANLAKREKSWAVLARAIWRELEVRDMANTEGEKDK